jgi:putative glutamine amidotransferase
MLNVMRGKPTIGIPADRRLLGHHYFHCVGEKYLAAVVDGADAIAVMIPALGAAVQLQQLLTSLDGILLTGSLSNVEPHHYQGPPSATGTLHDAHRDATTLPLIPLAVRSGVPLLAVCRGFQEMNVAFGGTLWQKLHEVPGLTDHREDLQAPLEQQYGPAHDVELIPGGVLYGMSDTSTLRVNSLHSQGVQQLGRGLKVEARAADGVIEAFSVSDAEAFAVAVQWHPEWQFQDNPFSCALFAAFGQAARARASRHRV